MSYLYAYTFVYVCGVRSAFLSHTSCCGLFVVCSLVFSCDWGVEGQGKEGKGVQSLCHESRNPPLACKSPCMKGKHYFCNSDFTLACRHRREQSHTHTHTHTPPQTITSEEFLSLQMRAGLWRGATASSSRRGGGQRGSRRGHGVFPDHRVAPQGP